MDSQVSQDLYKSHLSHRKKNTSLLLTPLFFWSDLYIFRLSLTLFQKDLRTCGIFIIVL